jgi:hypothetical protein
MPWIDSEYAPGGKSFVPDPPKPEPAQPSVRRLDAPGVSKKYGWPADWHLSGGPLDQLGWLKGFPPSMLTTNPALLHTAPIRVWLEDAVDAWHAERVSALRLLRFKV